MKFVRVQNGKISVGPCPLPDSWENVSNFSAFDLDFIISKGWFPYELVPVTLNAGEIYGDSELEILPNKVIEKQTKQPSPQQPNVYEEDLRPNTGDTVELINSVENGLTRIPYLTFGWVIFETHVKAGTRGTDELFTEGEYVVRNPSPFCDGEFGNTGCGYTWLYTKGLCKVTNLDTGVVQLRGAGYCNIDTPELVGVNKTEVLEDLTVFCLCGTSNAGKNPTVPVTKVFRLSQGESISLPANTKLFLASGRLDIYGTVLSTGQIRPKSDVIASALDDCLGLVFP
jgi:hypothetical protein